MKLINRSALVVSPRQPYVDWVNSLAADISGLEQPLSLADHQQEGRVYLIAEQQESGNRAELLAGHWQAIFTAELSGWDEFSDYWPQSLSVALFEQWFEAEPQLLVFDLAAQPLMVAELEG